MSYARTETADGQKQAVTIFFARMVCRAEDGPCRTCLDFCREWVTPRAYPIIKQAMMAAVRHDDISDAFGALLLSSIAADPNNSPPLKES